MPKYKQTRGERIMLAHARLCGKFTTVNNFQRSMDYIEHRKTAAAIDRLCDKLINPEKHKKPEPPTIDMYSKDRFVVDLGVLWQFRGNEMRYIERGKPGCWMPIRERDSQARIHVRAVIAWIESKGSKVVLYPEAN